MKIIIFLILNIFFVSSSVLSNLYSKNYSEILIKLKSEQNFLNVINHINSIKETNIAYQKFLNNNENLKKNSLLSALQISLLDELSRYYKIIIRSELKDSLINFLGRMPEIENVSENFVYKIESDRVIINDPLYKNQWYLKIINAEKAWALASGKDVLIGVVDTGIDFFHPDFKNNLWINPEEDLNKNGRFEPWSDTIYIDGVFGDLNGKDDDGNGYIDDIIGYDFVSQYNYNFGDWYEFDPIPNDEHGHGTLVSGVIVAEQNNNLGITGLAYGSKLVTLRAFDFSGNGQSDNIASAIIYAALNKIRIINLSFGENYYSPILHDAIKFAKSMDCLVVASSGNNGWDRPHFPSDYEEVISVGSSNSNNRRDQLSNYGNRLDLLAPGVNILTTSVNGDYRQVSGTSMAAPLVSAAAAILLELNPKLSSDELKGLLKSSATDVYTKGWDRESGSGILNIGNAVQFFLSSELTINYPENNSHFTKSKNQNLPIIGTITNPLFDYYQVYINNHSSPEKWDTISPKIFNQIINDTIWMIYLDELNNSSYIIRIVNGLKNNRTLEKRFSISVFDSDSFRIKLLKATPIYFNDKRAILITAESDKISDLTLEITDISTDDTITVVNHIKKDKFHQILLTEELNSRKEYICKAIFKFGNDIIKERKIFFSKSNDDFSIGNFKKKYNTLPLSYIFNGVIDLYGDKKKNIVVNDISRGIWHSTKIFLFEQNKFIQIDSMKSIWIPVGFGDSNGDSINEIFTKAFGSSKLFQSKNKGENPFNDVIFADTTNGDLWAAGMFDFDGDGKEELIAHTSSDIRIYKFSDGKYFILDMIKPVNEEFKLGTSPGITFGNFDIDPNPELACALQDGRIFIYEFTEGKFNKKWSDVSPNSRSPQFLESADIDGDGIKEIISANYGNTFFFGQETPADPVWTIRILKNKSPGNYEFIWSESFFGVKSGITQSGIAYRNGLFTGNIDKNIGDEIFLSVFPNLYIFNWDDNSKNMKPYAWFSSSFSNSGIVYDFDENGNNEFGFTSFRGLEFFELDTNFKIPPPTGIRAYAINDSTAFISWNNQEKADSYEIFEIFRINDEYFSRSIKITNEDTVLINGLKKSDWNYFVIQALNKSLNIKSDYSQIIEVFGNHPIYPTKAVQIDSNKIIINFSGKLSNTPPNPGNFYIKSENIYKMTPHSSNIAGDSSLILVFSKGLKDTNLALFSLRFLDYYKNPTLSLSIPIIKSLPPLDYKELYLSNLTVISKNEIILQFSEPVNLDEATNIANYSLKPFGKILSLELIEPDKIKLILDNSHLIGSIGYYYTITVTDVNAISGNPITKGSGNTLGFVFTAENAQNAYIYPNPINLSIDETATFANIPPDSKIIITTINGDVIRELIEKNNNGGVEWDLKTSNGDPLETGIYLFQVESKKQNLVIKKFSIVR